MTKGKKSAFIDPVEIIAVDASRYLVHAKVGEREPKWVSEYAFERFRDEAPPLFTEPDGRTRLMTREEKHAHASA